MLRPLLIAGALLVATAGLAPAGLPLGTAADRAYGIEAAEPARARVVGSRRSEVYHRPSCRHAARIASHNLVSWPSPAAARADGRRACRVCRP